jgi:hypothetical protein
VQTFPANPLIGNGCGIANTPNPRRRVKARSPDREIRRRRKRRDDVITIG